MDLTFQVPMKYCSLQHWTLLLSPVPSTTGYCFCFGSIPSFFLELFLHWSAVACWAPTDLGSSSFSILSFCLFILFMGFSRQEYWSGLPFPSPVPLRVIQVYAPTSNAEEAEVEWFYEDLQDLLELTPKKDVLFIIGDWNAKVGSQETTGVTGKFGLGIWNEAGQRLIIEFCQENALVIANTLFQQHKRRRYTWTSPDGQHQSQTDYILCSQRWRSSIQSTKQDQELTVAHIMNSILPNSDSNWRK